MGEKHAKANEIRTTTYTPEQRRGVRIGSSHTPAQAGAPGSAKKRYAVARGQLRFLPLPELPVGNSADLALIAIARKESDTTFTPAISSDLSRFSRIFSKIFEPCARSGHGALARSNARFWRASIAPLTGLELADDFGDIKGHP